MSSTTRPPDTIRLRSRPVIRPDQDVADGDDPAGPPDPLDGRPSDRLGDRTTGGLVDDLRFVAPTPTRRQRAAVRIFDLAVATTALILLFPLMVLVAVAVVVDSPGPVFYGSVRIGHRKPTFRAWKFRSMRPTADEDLGRLLADDGAARQEYQTYHKLRDDPRLTRVGAVIRQTSLDELPQLINILLGQMSVVGPRPKLHNDAEAYGPALDAVLSVKPGLTGLWQVSGRNRLPMAERVALDLDYVSNRTLRGDVAICVRTLVQLWQPGKHGAY